MRELVCTTPYNTHHVSQPGHLLLLFLYSSTPTIPVLLHSAGVTMVTYILVEAPFGRHGLSSILALALADRKPVVVGGRCHLLYHDVIQCNYVVFLRIDPLLHSKYLVHLINTSPLVRVDKHEPLGAISSSEARWTFTLSVI